MNKFLKALLFVSCFLFLVFLKVNIRVSAESVCQSAGCRQYACNGSKPNKYCQVWTYDSYSGAHRSSCTSNGQGCNINNCAPVSSCSGGGGGPPPPPTATPTPPCVCSGWTDGVCGGGGCVESKRRQTRNCGPASSCGGVETSRCVDQASCCNCTNWQDGICGGGACIPSRMRQTRNCPQSCAEESRCVDRASCTAEPPPVCNRGAWTNGSCGGGGCPANQRQQTRTVNPPSCDTTSQCVSDASCTVCNRGAWTNGSCGGGGCPANQRQQTRTVNPPSCDTTSQCVNDSVCPGGGGPPPPTPTFTPTPTQCNNGIDDDSDSFVDLSDPGCTDITDNDETDSATSWIKLKDSSFVGLSSLNNPIPASPLAYDGDDPGDRVFITSTSGNDPGSVTASNIDLGGADASVNKWLSGETAFLPQFTAPRFNDYTKARKSPVTISSFSEAQSSKINILTGNVTLDTNANGIIASTNPLVLLVKGNVTIDVSQFNVSGKSFAIISTGTITFTGQVQSAKGIFVAQTIDTGTTSNQGLKIEGNLIAKERLINGRHWNNDRRPGLFIVFEPEQYFDLLPLLSTKAYDWRQLK